MADKPKPRPVIEVIPSEAGGVSAIASANAPFIYFDMASTFGFNDGIANITLEALRFMSGIPGKESHPDRVVVAHLRMPFGAFMSLKAAMEGIEKKIAASIPPKGPNETAH